MFRKQIREELEARIKSNKAKAKADLNRKIAELKKSTNVKSRKNLTIYLDEAVDVELITRNEADLILAERVATTADDSWNTVNFGEWTPPEEANGSPKKEKSPPEDDSWPDEDDVPTLVPLPVPIGPHVSENAGTRTSSNNLSIVTTRTGTASTGMSGNIPSSNNRLLVTSVSIPETPASSGSKPATSGSIPETRTTEPTEDPVAIRLAEIEENPRELSKAAYDSLQKLKFNYVDYFTKLAINNYYGVRSYTGQPKNGNITNYDRARNLLTTTGYEFMEGKNIKLDHYLKIFSQYYVSRYVELYKQYIQKKRFVQYDEFSRFYNRYVNGYLEALKEYYPDTKRVTDQQKNNFIRAIQLEPLKIDDMRGGSRKVTRKVKMNKRRRASRRS